MKYKLLCFYHSSFILPPSSFYFAVLERPLSPAVAGDGLAVADQFVFVGRETFEADGAARVQLARADAKLCAEAVAKAVGETRRGVVIDARRINALQKKCR